MLLVHGADDQLVPPEISEHFFREARALGDDATLLELPRTDHFDVIDPTSHAWPRIAAAIARLFPTSR